MHVLMILFLLFYSFNFPDSPQCSVHFINKGLTIMGNDATIEWEGTGPSATTVVPAFACRLDRNAGGVFMPCKMLILEGKRGGGGRDGRRVTMVGKRCNWESNTGSAQLSIVSNMWQLDYAWSMTNRTV